MSENTTPEKPQVQQEVAPAKKLTNKQIVTLTFTVLGLVGFIAFIVQNWNRVGVEFLFWRFQIRIIFLIVLSFIAGGLTIFSFMTYRARRKKK